MASDQRLSQSRPQLPTTVERAMRSQFSVKVGMESQNAASKRLSARRKQKARAGLSASVSRSAPMTQLSATSGQTRARRRIQKRMTSLRQVEVVGEDLPRDQEAGQHVDAVRADFRERVPARAATNLLVKPASALVANDQTTKTRLSSKLQTARHRRSPRPDVFPRASLSPRACQELFCRFGQTICDSIGSCQNVRRSHWKRRTNCPSQKGRSHHCGS